jgi:pyruvate dehydrogenase E1 component alpha subunit
VKKIIQKFEVEYLQVLDEKGNADEKQMPKLTDVQIKKIYEMMILVRAFDDRSFSLQRQGRIGSYLQVKGQEASQVGSVFFLKDKDWVVPMYRSSGALIARKHPMYMLYQYWGGDERGLKSPAGVNNLPISIPVGTQTAHGSGIGWASKLKKEKTIALTFFGDGATSKSEFHTGLNFAGVFGTNTVFVCENNQYAISTPREKQTHAKTIAQKAIAYGIKGIQVDGNDIFAVLKVVGDAIDNARKGIPTLVECMTYRRGDHSTSDDAKKYRKDAEVKAWEKKDPILRLEKYMKNQKLLTDAYKKSVAKKATKEVDMAVEKYEKIQPAKKDDIFTYMFEEMPQQLQEQYDEMRRR